MWCPVNMCSNFSSIVGVCHSHSPLILSREVELQQPRGRLHEELLAVEWQDAMVVLGGEVCGNFFWDLRSGSRIGARWCLTPPSGREDFGHVVRKLDSDQFVIYIPSGQGRQGRREILKWTMEKVTEIPKPNYNPEIERATSAATSHSQWFS